MHACLEVAALTMPDYTSFDVSCRVPAVAGSLLAALQLALDTPEIWLHGHHGLHAWAGCAAWAAWTVHLSSRLLMEDSQI
jgi:hypothetical protein